MTVGELIDSFIDAAAFGHAEARALARIGFANHFAGALLLGLFYLSTSVRFWSQVSDLSARRLLRASFLYLPAILALLLLNPLPE